ncbi:Protein of unknown function [Ruminococcaceae bacterium YRB3002]|nr:Protein of unknown function [Ruminococcaceae bacterium YRB3002]
MWNRKDVKAKGKASFKANFWKCVATAMILAIIGGGVSSAGGSGTSMTNYFSNRNTNQQVEVHKEDDGSIVIDTESLIGNVEQVESTVVDTEKLTEEDAASVDEIPGAVIAMIFLIVAVISLVVMAIGFVIDAFIINPIELGCRRFFRRNLDEPATLSNLTFAFDNNYKNIVKTMFLRDLFITLWSMLLVIPGIVKSYEYKMIPYLLSEDPAMTREEAFAESKRLMKGNKWKAFVLDLSFILWDLASLFTCGLAGIFYVNPYKQSTDAALYEAIRYGTETK